MKRSLLLALAVAFDVVAAAMLWLGGNHAFAAFMAVVAVVGAVFAVVLWTRGL